jgi:accessory gene regulator protein AgrB
MRPLKSIVFYIMLYSRGAFLFVAKFLSFCFIISAIGSYFAGNSLVCWILMILSFLTFVLRHFYDNITLKLNPNNNTLILNQ